MIGKQKCDRCPIPTDVTIMSKFNQDTICTDCKEDEKQAPNYQRADEAEIASVRAKNYNFPGIGLAPEDRAFLAERLKARLPKLMPCGEREHPNHDAGRCYYCMAET